MGLVVEDGTGVVGANSYASVEQYRAYHADRGVDLAGVTDSTIEAHLISATEFVDQLPWHGQPRYFDRARRRAIPRDGFVVGCGNPYLHEGHLIPNTEVPWVVVDAVVILAEVERSTGEKLGTARDRGRLLVSKSVGRGAVSRVWADPTAPRTYPSAMALLRGLHAAGGRRLSPG